MQETFVTVTRQENRHHEYRQRRPLHLCDTKVTFSPRCSPLFTLYLDNVFSFLFRLSLRLAVLSQLVSNLLTLAPGIFCFCRTYHGSTPSPVFSGLRLAPNGYFDKVIGFLYFCKTMGIFRRFLKFSIY